MFSQFLKIAQFEEGLHRWNHYVPQSLGEVPWSEHWIIFFVRKQIGLYLPALCTAFAQSSPDRLHLRSPIAAPGLSSSGGAPKENQFLPWFLKRTRKCTSLLSQTTRPHCCLGLAFSEILGGSSGTQGVYGNCPAIEGYAVMLEVGTNRAMFFFF